MNQSNFSNGCKKQRPLYISRFNEAPLLKIGHCKILIATGGFKEGAEGARGSSLLRGTVTGNPSGAEAPPPPQGDP